MRIGRKLQYLLVLAMRDGRSTSQFFKVLLGTKRTRMIDGYRFRGTLT